MLEIVLFLSKYIMAGTIMLAVLLFFSKRSKLDEESTVDQKVRNLIENQKILQESLRESFVGLNVKLDRSMKFINESMSLTVNAFTRQVRDMERSIDDRLKVHEDVIQKKIDKIHEDNMINRRQMRDVMENLNAINDIHNLPRLIVRTREDDQ